MFVVIFRGVAKHCHEAITAGKEPLISTITVAIRLILEVVFDSARSAITLGMPKSSGSPKRQTIPTRIVQRIRAMCRVRTARVCISTYREISVLDQFRIPGVP